MGRRTYHVPCCYATRASHSIAAILISMVCLWDAGTVAAHAATCSVAISLVATDRKVVAQGGRLVDSNLLRVTIRNVGRQAITLVQPGDGSDSGLRTPTVTWSVRDAGGNAILQHPGAREDNLINPLEPREVFRLEPSMGHELAPWIPPIVVGGPGKYVVTLHYVNDPNLTWSGTPIRAHDAATMALVAGSTFCDAVSGPMELDVQATDVERK